jgi:hypothetical protein
MRRLSHIIRGVRGWVLGLGLALAIAMPSPLAAGSSPRADKLGLEVPRGSKVTGDQLWSSALGFRKTVEFYERLLKRKSLAHEAVPVYRYRGVTVARFISTADGARWRAIHVFHRRGATRIYLVPGSS